MKDFATKLQKAWFPNRKPVVIGISEVINVTGMPPSAPPGFFTDPKDKTVKPDRRSQGRFTRAPAKVDLEIGPAKIAMDLTPDQSDQVFNSFMDLTKNACRREVAGTWQAWGAAALSACGALLLILAVSEGIRNRPYNEP